MESQPSLSPEEIAEFTQALKTDGANDRLRREVRPYDFLHPDKLSKAHLRVIQLVLSGLEKSWSESLSASLRGEAEVVLDTLEQVSFGAYLQSVQSIRHVATFTMGFLPGTGFIEMPAALALGIVDRLAGGKGVWKGAERGLTPVEQKIVARVLDRVVGEFARAWHPMVDMKAALTGSCPPPEDAGIGSTEAILVAGFTCGIAGGEHTVNLIIPAGALEPVKDLLTQERWLEGRGSGSGTVTSRSSGTSASALLDTVAVEVAAELGRAGVSMQDVLNIGLGDVIRLDRSVDDALDMKVQDYVKFQGRPGLVGNKLVIQITEESAPAARDTTQMPEAALSETT